MTHIGQRLVTKANTPTKEEPTVERQPRIIPDNAAAKPSTVPMIQQENKNNETDWSRLTSFWTEVGKGMCKLSLSSLLIAAIGLVAFPGLGGVQ